MHRRALLATPFLATAAHADTWPDRPVRMIIPWPPGGGNDIVGRIVSERLAHALSRPVVVENRGGSNGVIGAEVVAKSRPDGYTLMFHSVTSHVVNPVVYPRLPYDTERDFIAASILGYSALAIIVNPGLGIRTLPELIARIRAQPGRFNYASFGNASAGHLAGELFKQRLGLDIVHVPYRGGGPALADTISGAIPMNFSGINTAASALRGGLVVPLAVTGAERSSILPDVPTVAEAAGLPDFEMGVTYAVWAPAGTPDAIVERIAIECTAGLRDPGAQAILAQNGVEVLAPMSAAQRAARVAREAAVLGRVVRESRLTLE
ncbi:Bug family tripartite tricarboxylate transporter substrate binding protein [Plastoroseomonas arctica]|uniref:Tripartite tricarboxylate transporter substrate binding protein n=1 Tax=Plastoroseomonas arctica TaxID=1509237 RepID=A0AAF1JZF5_9PROT|nr:tripartite tricarboxylate transporter substrate binding protein [Plastoroseomonas arctica]MBR0654243.1 tripartite tricarboxylate transporter substrate binding protein [Plastoroseomonas arctica]